MKRFAAAIALACSAAAAAAQSPPSGPFANEYSIQVKLDASTMTIEGTERVVFRNLGTKPVESLPFHLYANAWSHTGTAWVRDARAEENVLRRGDEDGGFVRIDSIALDGGADLADRTEIDDTIMRVALPQPVAPGGEVAMRIAFATKLPRTVARMGQWNGHVDAMQWFPKVCAHLDDRFVDWPFHEPSEFFADFGVYDVSITLPTAFEIEATGVHVPDKERTGDDVKTVHFHASAVHDFAWCADREFIRHEATVAGGTQVVLMSQPFMEPKAQLVMDVTRFSLAKYGEWFMPYPYPRVVIDATPAGLGGGMEYPMLFTISAAGPEVMRWVRERSESPAGVTVHEFGHQYWYGIVATNEFEEAWLDEGINTYVTNKVLESFFGTCLDPHPGLPALTAQRVYQPLLAGGDLLGGVIGFDRGPFLPQDKGPRTRDRGDLLFGFGWPDVSVPASFGDRFHARKATYVPVADVTRLERISWEVYPADRRTAYSAAAYSKPTLMLRTLENRVGWDAVRELLKAWATRYAFQHPTARDFLALAAERLPATEVEMLQACIETTDTVDWAVEEVRAIEDAPPQGFLPQRKPGDPMLSRFEEPKPERSWLERALRLASGRKAEVKPDGNPWRAEVVIRNRGRLAIATELQLVFADGSEVRMPIDAKVPYSRIDVPARAAKIVSATIDPDRRIALDLDVTNNARLAEPDRKSAAALAHWAQFWVQNWLTGIAWFS